MNMKIRNLSSTIHHSVSLIKLLLNVMTNLVPSPRQQRVGSNMAMVTCSKVLLDLKAVHERIYGIDHVDKELPLPDRSTMEYL